MPGMKHGVYVHEQATSVFPPTRVESSLPFVVGTAPVAKLATAGPVNEPRLISTYAEFVRTFGMDDDWGGYTLCEFADVYFGQYAMAPAVFVNVLDPAAHKTAVPEGAASFDAEGRLSLGRYGITALVIKSGDGATTYVDGVDYVLDPALGVVTRKAGGAIAAGATVRRAFSYVDPAKVDADDVIGGVDSATARRTGLELINEVFPKFRLVPGQVVAPGWSQTPAVAVVMGAKAKAINGMFRAVAVVDLPESVAAYSDAPGYKASGNLEDETMIVCWPRLKLGSKTCWMSSHVAGVIARTDAANEEVPCKSPSNERLLVDSVVNSGVEVSLGLDEANYLNSQGIVTALNWVGGWRLWGSRTACYPGVTDVKDAFIPLKRMFAWLANEVILSVWQKVDAPVRRRLIESIVDSYNIRLNGLAAREFILGGRLEFSESENAVTDLMDGLLTFHLYVTPPSPAEEINFLLEYDPAYVQTLLGGE